MKSLHDNISCGDPRISEVTGSVTSLAGYYSNREV